jgi:hypothetical protein
MDSEGVLHYVTFTFQYIVSCGVLLVFDAIHISSRHALSLFTLAAPVELGMMFWLAPRPPRQSLLDGPSTVFCVAASGMSF